MSKLKAIRFRRLFLLFFLASLFSAVLYFFLPKNSLVVEDQPLGEAVFIKRLTLARGGFVVIQAVDPGGEPGAFIGDLEFFPAGTYTNINVEFDFENSGEDLKLKTGDLIFITLYQDYGDGAFDANGDRAVIKLNGKPFRKNITFY